MYDIDFDQRYWGFKRNAKKVFFKWVTGCFFFGSAMVMARGIDYDFIIVACVSVFYGVLAVAIYSVAYYLRWHGGKVGQFLTKPRKIW
ncbi:hypothetical protein JC525_08865 [Alteromonas sp. IB21]|uniref:hypothetical protein n=1 Tax=Alteromonas sp. IB21 TaxID=2779369 RepID=UPI0018E83937|nr:hypothetical protein [Alteromonas sp. IB21]MBJ2129046.1 hypothetical protein [Alteromonas sp. IB21]